MAAKFGTSGLRGLVSELTDAVCADYVRAFLGICDHHGRLFVGRDLRPSSPRISQAVIRGAHQMGLDAVDCGVLSTPALALAAMEVGAPSVMVTGSHIPADRNGLKFYTSDGEITKDDEEAILTRYLADQGDRDFGSGQTTSDAAPLGSYIARYLDYFPAQCLRGLRIGNYQHSSVSRDALGEVLSGLGADVVDLGRSEKFIPVDTEALDPGLSANLKSWSAAHRLDAIVSTDGDGDRPLVADETGSPVAGDILGVLTALRLGAEAVVTPVSSTTVVERVGVFARVARTRIGSPYVIEGMTETGNLRGVGFEANGGFLLGFRAQNGDRTIAPLRTRDSFLPILATLVTAAERGLPLSRLVAQLPPRWTASDRIQGIATEKSQALVRLLTENAAERAAFLAPFGTQEAMDLTDGLRITLTSGQILHLRPSGNAPELRCYAEADTLSEATSLVQSALQTVRKSLT